MKPKIGLKVFVLYKDCILVDTVAFIGSGSFLISSFGTSTYEDSWEWYYDEYEVNWFTDIKKAKEELVSRFEDEYDGKIKITKRSDTCYEVEEDEEPVLIEDLLEG